MFSSNEHIVDFNCKVSDSPSLSKTKFSRSLRQGDAPSIHDYRLTVVPSLGVWLQQFWGNLQLRGNSKSTINYVTVQKVQLHRKCNHPWIHGAGRVVAEMPADLEWVVQEKVHRLCEEHPNGARIYNLTFNQSPHSPLVTDAYNPIR